MEGEPSKPFATRIPKFDYKNHNGFTDSVAQTLRGERPGARELNPGVSASELEYIESRMSRDVVDRHRFVGDFMELRGDYFPSLEEMKRVNTEGGTSASLLRQIKKTRERHRDDLSRLFDLQTQDYIEEAIDQYASKDDAIMIPDIDRFYSALRKTDVPLLTSQISQFEALRWSYIKTLTPLVRQYNETLNKEKDPRLRRNQFPLNVSEFRRMVDKEMQYKIAKILTQDVAGQDRLLQRYGWSFDKLKPVDDECASNPQFKIEVQNIVQQWEITHSAPTKP